MDNSKSKKRKILNSAVAVILAVILVVGGSTFAYLQDDTKDIVNNFKTNQVSVDLSESTGSEYDIIPGTSQSKNPTVTVSTTLPAYVFLEVTDNTDSLVEYKLTDGWIPLDGFDGVYYREADSDTDYQVLKGNMVTYSSSLENSDMVVDNGDGTYSLKEGITLSFKAQAIQKEPFKNAVDAYCQINSIINWNEVTNSSVVNSLKKFRISVVKSDIETGKAQGDATLSGAVYGIYKGDQLIDTYTTDENASFK